MARLARAGPERGLGEVGAVQLTVLPAGTEICRLNYGGCRGPFSWSQPCALLGQDEAEKGNKAQGSSRRRPYLSFGWEVRAAAQLGE